jgi:hypothetical protein
MIKRPVFPENPKSYFPVIVKYIDQENPVRVESPFDIRDGIEFKVLSVRVSRKRT